MRYIDNTIITIIKKPSTSYRTNPIPSTPVLLFFGGVRKQKNPILLDWVF
jgi:hypothetical protein